MSAVLDAKRQKVKNSVSYMRSLEFLGSHGAKAGDPLSHHLILVLASRYVLSVLNSVYLF